MGAVKRKNSLLSFQVQQSWFALPLNSVEGVASLSEVVAIPGNNSRVFVGVAYILGHLMTVIDIAPLFNIGSARSAKEFLVVHHDTGYYALKVTAIGEIASGQKIRRITKKKIECAKAYLIKKKQKIVILDENILIERYVCR